MSLLTDITPRPVKRLLRIQEPTLEFLNADTTDNNDIQINDTFTIETMFYGVQAGRVDRIVSNPFGDGLAAYVIPLDLSQGWTAYLDVKTGAVL